LGVHFNNWGSWEEVWCVCMCVLGGAGGGSLSLRARIIRGQDGGYESESWTAASNDATTMIATIEADPNKARARGRFALGALLLACAGLLATAAAALSFRESALGEASDHLESEAQECSPARPTVAQTLQIKRRNTAPCPARSMRPPPRWVCAGAPPPACDGGASN